MPLHDYISDKHPPLTQDMLETLFAACGVQTGQVLLLHSSLSALGYVIGGAHTVLRALANVLGSDGTLVVPTHTGDNSDPANWENPPVPREWWQTIRDHMPAYDAGRTPSVGVGVMPELFRSWPGVRRSAHPVASFAALGPDADDILVDHTSLEAWFGEESPLSKIYRLNGCVMLLGVTHSANTSLHLAEHRATYPNKRTVRDGTAVFVSGERQWKTFDMFDYDTADFEACGEAFEDTHNIPVYQVGRASVRLMPQRDLVDFAADWFTVNRDG